MTFGNSINLWKAIVLWMVHLYLYCIQGHKDIPENTSHDMPAKRESCKSCDAGSYCQRVSAIFTRKTMNVGYNHVTTVPAGACNLTVIENYKTQNKIALRWMNYKQYFLNGEWTIERSGNYTSGDNSFIYENSEGPLNGNKFGDQIWFTSQTTHGVEIFLIIQKENLGLRFSYLLPPIKKEQDQSTKFKTDQIIANMVSADKTKNKKPQEKFHVNETSQMFNTKEKLSKTGLKILQTGKKGILFINRQASQEDQTLPSWIKDFKNILIEWKRQLDSQADDIETLTNEMKRKYEDTNRRLTSSIETLTNEMNRKFEDANRGLISSIDTLTNGMNRKFEDANRRLTSSIETLTNGQMRCKHAVVSSDSCTGYCERRSSLDGRFTSTPTAIVALVKTKNSGKQSWCWSTSISKNEIVIKFNKQEGAGGSLNCAYMACGR